MRYLVLITLLTTAVFSNYSNKVVNDRYTKVKHIITQASDKYDVPYNILKSMLYTESRFNPKAVSPTGAIGISQYTKSTAKRYGVNPRNVRSSIYGMARTMRDHYDNSSKDFTVKERWKISAYFYNQGKGSYFKNKKQVIAKGFEPTYANVTLQIALNGKNNEGLLYISNIKI